MSPYMKAYQAGVKLAQLHWLGKYAAEDDPGITDQPNIQMMEPTIEDAYPGEPRSDQQALADLNSVVSEIDAEQGAKDPVLQEIERLNRLQRQGGVQDFMGPLQYANQATVPSTDSDRYPAQSAYPAPNMSMPQQAASLGFSLPNFGEAPGSGQFPGMLLPDRSNAPQAAQPQAAQPQAAQPQAEAQQVAPRFDYQAVNQDGMVDQDARFNVQAGNYRKQFNRFREQFGGGQEDAFKGLNYRDFAGALGNRGLRVGDSLSASDIMSRLQGIRQNNYNREQGMPVASRGAGLDPLEIQNRRGNIANRGILAVQRAAGQRASTAPGIQMAMPTRTPNMVGGRLPMVGTQPSSPAPSRPAPSSPAPSRPAPSRPAPMNLASNNPAPRFGTFKSTDGKGGNTTTTLSGMTQDEGNNLMASMRSSLRGMR